MSKVFIEKFNASFIRVYSDDFGIEQELSEYFTYEFPNFKFTPKYRAGLWDGKVRLYNLQKKLMRFGLLYQLIKFLNRNNLEFELIGEFVQPPMKISIEEVEGFMLSLEGKMPDGELIVPHDYQIAAVYHSINEGRLIVKSATGSGKSYILYCLSRWYIGLGMKMLIIAPTTMLVEQLVSDFTDYAKGTDFVVDDFVQKIYSGFSKNIAKQITISTWQSIYKLPPKFFNLFNVITVDEAHKSTADALTGLYDKATAVEFRHGFTGTIDDKRLNKLVLNGIIGKIYEANTTEELIKKGVLSELKIKVVNLNYSKEESKIASGFTDYNQELDFLFNHNRRNSFIAHTAAATKGNTIVLVRRIEHGKVLLKMIQELVGDTRKVFYIAGSVKPADRERIRKELQGLTDAIVIGSVQIMSTGVNIPSLANIIFASPTKSVYVVLQSIGRVLRLMDGKKYATLIDIGDNLTYNRKKNISQRHLTDRLKIYLKERFKFELIDMEF